MIQVVVVVKITTSPILKPVIVNMNSQSVLTIGLMTMSSPPFTKYCKVFGSFLYFAYTYNSATGGVMLGVSGGVPVWVIVGVGVVLVEVGVGVGVIDVAVGVKPGHTVLVAVIVGLIDGVKLIVGVMLGVGVGVYLNAITYKYQFLTRYS